MSTYNFVSFEVILGYKSNLFLSALHVLWKKVSAGNDTHFLTGEVKPGSHWWWDKAPWVRAFELTRVETEESRLWGPAHQIQFCQSLT